MRLAATSSAVSQSLRSCTGTRHSAHIAYRACRLIDVEKLTINRSADQPSARRKGDRSNRSDTRTQIGHQSRGSGGGVDGIELTTRAQTIQYTRRRIKVGAEDIRDSRAE